MSALRAVVADFPPRFRSAARLNAFVGMIVPVRSKMARFLIVVGLAGFAAAQPHRVQSIDVKVLSTMLADTDGIGEWGFSALVVADGHRILFDTGARPETVLNNARDLKIELTTIPDVILSHAKLPSILWNRRFWRRRAAPRRLLVSKWGLYSGSG